MKFRNRIIKIPTFKDERGFLTVLEDLLPFTIKRIYWIYAADNKIRGGHRHKVTKQALIAISGEVSLKINNGHKEENYILDNPSECIIIEPEDWHSMTFRDNAVLIVFASHKYDASDYINSNYSLQR